MGNEMSIVKSRGIAATTVWKAGCKDCETERRSGRQAADSLAFEYSAEWAQRTVERGNCRSDRCERHRKQHREAIQAIAIAYVDLHTVGTVADRLNPTGPLGGLGPLPIDHIQAKHENDLSTFAFGMSDADILAILDGLTKHRVAVVEAGTGTGKSTFMPFRLMNPPPGAPLRLTEFGPIVVTEPRKAAAIGVATFVGESLCFGHDSRTCSCHIGSGYPVGYQVSGDCKWDSACQLIYVTDGTIINWVRDGKLSTIGTVIVDEAHERSENIDIILAQLRDQVRRYKHLRVIITSATLDRDFFIEYFGGLQHVHYQYAAPQKSFGYGVPFFLGTEITDSVIEHGLVLDGEKDGADITPTERFDGWPAAVRATDGAETEDLRDTTRVLRSIPRPRPLPMEDWKERMPRTVAEQIVSIALATDVGDILGFLPTTDAISEAVSAIRGGLGARASDFDVYPLLATTPAAIRDKALEARLGGERRKIVVSSNLAETSLTVRGVRYIVDSGLICQPEWDPELAAGSYPTKPHSRSGVRQRWGRVGRDSPGWVFPLYTVEQYLSLPKDTPPGSTQTNLEMFCMKLLSAGCDMNRVVLPANFTHDKVSRDSDARRSIDTFNRELVRAKNALAASGAVDSDGHLTDFGRDLERFPGSGSRAIAIMLADQLACVHEVALALAVLCDGRIIGGDSGLLRYSREWPPAWRVHATRCHRALAVGCEDDLDILLRIASDWQSAENPDEYCSTWWINADVLREGFAAVEQTILSLSPAMKSEAHRPVIPALADRVRVVLTRAMSAHLYSRTDGDLYVRPGHEESLCVQLDRCSLVAAPGERIIALNRFRRPPDRSGVEQPPIISNVVRPVSWAESNDCSADHMGIDLAARAASHARRDPDHRLVQTPDVFYELRKQFPVGTIADITLGGIDGTGAEVRTLNRVSRPFLFPEERYPSDEKGYRRRPAQPARRQAMPPSGFDAEWDPFTHRDPEPPDEEKTETILDIRDMETNDARTGAVPLPHSSPEHPAAGTSPTPHGMKLVALPHHPRGDLHDIIRAEIVGYRRVDDTTVGVVVDAFDADMTRVDPAAHSDLKYWDAVELEVRGVVSDHENECVEFSRTDNRGRFYLSGRRERAGIDPLDWGFPRRLRDGAQVIGRVIPDGSSDAHVTVTFVTSALDHLASAESTANANAGGTPVKYFPASIVEEANDRSNVMVELDHRDSTTGMSHRFSVWEGHLQKRPGLSGELGQRILVALGVDPRAFRRRALPVTDETMDALQEKYQAYVQTIDHQLQARSATLPMELIHELLALGQSRQWAADVWMFYVDSLYLSVVSVQPVTQRAIIELPLELAEFARSRYRSAKNRDVVVSVDTSTGKAEVVAVEQGLLDAAANDLNAIANLPFIVARLPPNTAGKVIGKAGAMIKQLSSRTNIVNIQVQDEVVTVVGNTANSVIETVREIRGLVTTVVGEMTVPLGKNGYIIGKGGTTIQAMRLATNCRADNPDKGQKWIIEGPSRDAVGAFFQMAASKAAGTTGRILSASTITVLTDTTKKKPPKHREKISPSAPSCGMTMPGESRVPSAEKPTQPGCGVVVIVTLAAIASAAACILVLLR